MAELSVEFFNVATNVEKKSFFPNDIHLLCQKLNCWIPRRGENTKQCFIHIFCLPVCVDIAGTDV